MRRGSGILALAALIVLAGFGCAKGKATISSQELAASALSELTNAEALSITADITVLPALSTTKPEASGSRDSSASTVVRYTGVVSDAVQQGNVRMTFWGGLLPLTFEADVLAINGVPYLKLTEAPTIPVFDFSEYTDMWYGGNASAFTDIADTVSGSLGWNIGLLTKPVIGNESPETAFVITDDAGTEKREAGGKTVSERHLKAALSETAAEHALAELEKRGYSEEQRDEARAMLSALSFDLWIDTETKRLNRFGAELPQSDAYLGLNALVQIEETDAPLSAEAPSEVRDIADLIPDTEDLETLQSLIHASSAL